MESRSSQKEQPAGIKKRVNTKINCCWYKQTIFGLLERNR